MCIYIIYRYLCFILHIIQLPCSVWTAVADHHGPADPVPRLSAVMGASGSGKTSGPHGFVQEETRKK